MADESMNNPLDLVEERFSQLESQFAKIKHNVRLLNMSLTNMLRLFIEDGGFNLQVQLEETKKESKKEPEKE